MALTPQIRVTQSEVLAETTPSIDIRATQAELLAAINFPTAQVRVTQSDVLASIKFPADALRVTQAEGMVYAQPALSIRVTQTEVLAYVRGRIQNPRLRAWTFSLDGHDFYVLRLGMDLTLVYDLYSEQWVDWDAFNETYWPVNLGINWIGGTEILDSTKQSYGSNVLIGDDTYGLLWFLNPEQPYDQHPEVANAVQEIFFERVLQGQVVQTGRGVQPCYVVWLTTNMGTPGYVGAGVKLEISDDAGKTYDDMGTVTVTTGVNDPELSWYSLGQVEAPGRLFRITDDGAVARIDNMEMNDPDNAG